MKSLMMKIPMIGLVVWPYVFLAGMFLGGGAYFGIICILTIVLAILNVVNVCTYVGDNVAKELDLWGMITKLVHMPYYVVVIVTGLIAFLSVMAQPSLSGSLAGMSLLALTGIVFMAMSSLYSVKAVFAARDNKLVKKDSAMMFAITSFIMFADVICAILIYNKIKKNKKVVGK